MSRCSDCQELSISESRRSNILLKENLASLIESAKNGCPFCSMCWHQFQLESDLEDIDNILEASKRDDFDRSDDLNIYVRSTFSDVDRNCDRLIIDNTRFSNCALRIFSGEIIDDIENLFWEAKLHAELDIFAEPGTLAAKTIRGRNFTSASNPDDYISWAKTCLLECQDYHPGCGASLDWEMPTRVIDLGPPGVGSTPYILETNGNFGKYMTLSYCWGDAVKPQIKLKTSTYPVMLRGFDEQLLTKTHRETLLLARELGYQYVWIDALCIIQDDMRDWEKESSRMADCYQNSNLNLVAGRSGNSLIGFMENNFTPAILPIRFEYTSCDAPGEISDIYVCLPRSVDTGPVEDRAWCYQENILSRRSLTFGLEKLIVDCQGRCYIESGAVTNHHQIVDRSHHLSDFVSMSGDPATIKEKILSEWYGIVARYTKCDMFEPHDVFAALMGLATIVQKTLRSRYLAGLWEDDLVRGLLWQSAHDTYGSASFPALKRPKERNTKKPLVLGLPAVRAPSWSWASVEGPAEQATYHGQESDEEMFVKTPENLCVRPALQNPTRWTSHTDCGVDKASMPLCELKLFGAPALVQRSKTPLTEDFKRDTSWRFAGARVAKFAVLCSSQSPDHRVGMGLFDVENEQTDSLWCMRLIRDRGLMLRMDHDGKFHRLGKFVVLDEAWFQKQPDKKVSLL